MSAWEDIVGHEWAVASLRLALAHERVGHAYLFTGPAQVGKTTLALTFAQALTCTDTRLEARPCGRCRACTLIAARRHPDVIILAGERSGRGQTSIKIDQIRELQQQLALTATEARCKVAVVRNFEDANANAANAFLKTLEEPPPNVILLLTAANADLLLPTIASRCQAVALRPLPATVIERALRQRWAVDQEEAALVGRLADGRLGWAVEAIGDPAILAQRQAHLDRLAETLGQARVGRFAAAEALAAEADSLPDVLLAWLSWWRDLALLAAANGQSEGITNVDRRQELLGLAERWHGQRIVDCLRQTEQALWQLSRNANTRLVIENLLLAYPLPS